MLTKHRQLRRYYSSISLNVGKTRGKPFTFLVSLCFSLEHRRRFGFGVGASFGRLWMHFDYSPYPLKAGVSGKGGPGGSNRKVWGRGKGLGYFIHFSFFFLYIKAFLWAFLGIKILDT